MRRFRHRTSLARNGVVLENAYCNPPLCAPWRFSRLSGRLPSFIGSCDNAAEFPSSLQTRPAMCGPGVDESIAKEAFSRRGPAASLRGTFAERPSAGRFRLDPGRSRQAGIRTILSPWRKSTFCWTNIPGLVAGAATACRPGRPWIRPAWRMWQTNWKRSKAQVSGSDTDGFDPRQILRENSICFL